MGWLLLPHYALAAVLDARARSVPNAVWLHVALLGFVAWWLEPSLSFLLAFPLGWFLWSRAGMGGADGKGVILAGLGLGPVGLVVAVSLAMVGSGAWLLRRTGRSSPFLLFLAPAYAFGAWLG